MAKLIVSSSRQPGREEETTKHENSKNIHSHKYFFKKNAQHTVIRARLGAIAPKRVVVAWEASEPALEKGNVEQTGVVVDELCVVCL